MASPVRAPGPEKDLFEALDPDGTDVAPRASPPQRCEPGVGQGLEAPEARSRPARYIGRPGDVETLSVASSGNPKRRRLAGNRPWCAAGAVDAVIAAPDYDQAMLTPPSPGEQADAAGHLGTISITAAGPQPGQRCGSSDREVPVATARSSRHNQDEGSPSVNAVPEAHSARSGGRDTATAYANRPKEGGRGDETDVAPRRSRQALLLRNLSAARQDGKSGRRTAGSTS